MTRRSFGSMIDVRTVLFWVLEVVVFLVGATLLVWTLTSSPSRPQGYLVPGALILLSVAGVVRYVTVRMRGRKRSAGADGYD